jgi:hypothetical protein
LWRRRMLASRRGRSERWSTPAMSPTRQGCRHALALQEAVGWCVAMRRLPCSAGGGCCDCDAIIPTTADQHHCLIERHECERSYATLR